jgi:hypothetical protein
LALLHNFTLTDIAAGIAAVCLFPLFVLIPGYAVAWLLDLFEFRRRTWLFRWALSVPLSIAIAPILSYLAGRYLSMTAVWGLYAASWVYVVVVMLRSRGEISYTVKAQPLAHARGSACAFDRAATCRSAVRERLRTFETFGHLIVSRLLRRSRWPAPRSPAGAWRMAAVVLSIWGALALFSLVDLQLGGKLYYSTTAFDYSVRTEFIHAISTTGIPPANPFFFPGHAQPLRYHYFWMILCSMVDVAGGAFVGPRHAWIGGAIWCGAGFLALVALYFRLIAYRGPETFQRRTLVGILLLGVTGLDILPNAFYWLTYAMGLTGFIPPSLEWWNEQVDGFTFTALWEAHYLSALVACLMAFLLLSEAPRHTGSGRWKYAALAGIALASTVGASVYIAFVFGAFLMLWTVVALAKKWRAEAAALLFAGALCVVLVLPYLASVTAGSGSGGFPIAFRVRRFFPVDTILASQGRSQAWQLALVDGATLPLNYLFELGFFLAAGLLWWRRRRARREPLSRQPLPRQPLSREELAIALMIATSVAICSCLCSTPAGNNDLGWRGFLVAQFGLLLWSVDVLTDRRYQRSLVLAVMIALGAAGTVCDVFLFRLYPVLADRGVLPELPWMSPDHSLGERNYAVREAYEWADSHMPSAAIVEFSPHAFFQDTPGFLYSNRQIAAAGQQCLAAFGGDASLCAPMVAAADLLFPERGQPAPESSAACEKLGADILIAKDTDFVWSVQNSWVWREKPLYANRLVRVFECRN